MKNRILLSIILFFVLFSLTGCYDANSIEASYYIVAIGIDSGKDNSYILSVQIAKNENSSSDSSSSQSSDYAIYQVECSTFENGISILNNYLNKTINLSHCSAIVFSEKISRAGIGNIINSLASNDEIRPSAYILISNKTAYDVLDKVSNSGENFSSRFYEYIINSADYTGYSDKMSFEEFAMKINSPIEDCTAIYTHVDDKNVQNAGLAIFKNDKMIGNTSVLDSISQLILTNELKESLITIPSPFNTNDYIDLEIKLNKNSKINVDIINDTPFISFNVFLHANIKTSGKNFDYTNNENIKILNYYGEKYIEKMILNYLYKTAKEYNSDIIGFQKSFSKKCLTTSELKKYKFDKVFKDSFFNANVNLKIESTNLFSKE